MIQLKFVYLRIYYTDIIWNNLLRLFILTSEYITTILTNNYLKNIYTNAFLSLKHFNIVYTVNRIIFKKYKKTSHLEIGILQSQIAKICRIEKV